MEQLSTIVENALKPFSGTSTSSRSRSRFRSSTASPDGEKPQTLLDWTGHWVMLASLSGHTRIEPSDYIDERIADTQRKVVPLPTITHPSTTSQIELEEPALPNNPRFKQHHSSFVSEFSSIDISSESAPVAAPPPPSIGGRSYSLSQFVRSRSSSTASLDLETPVDSSNVTAPVKRASSAWVGSEVPPPLASRKSFSLSNSSQVFKSTPEQPKPPQLSRRQTEPSLHAISTPIAPRSSVKSAKKVEVIPEKQTVVPLNASLRHLVSALLPQWQQGVVPTSAMMPNLIEVESQAESYQLQTNLEYADAPEKDSLDTILDKSWPIRRYKCARNTEGNEENLVEQLRNHNRLVHWHQKYLAKLLPTVWSALFNATSSLGALFSPRTTANVQTQLLTDSALVQTLSIGLSNLHVTCIPLVIKSLVGWFGSQDALLSRSLPLFPTFAHSSQLVEGSQPHPGLLQRTKSLSSVLTSSSASPKPLTSKSSENSYVAVIATVSPVREDVWFGTAAVLRRVLIDLHASPSMLHHSPQLVLVVRSMLERMEILLVHHLIAAKSADIAKLPRSHGKFLRRCHYNYTHVMHAFIMLLQTDLRAIPTEKWERIWPFSQRHVAVSLISASIHECLRIRLRRQSRHQRLLRSELATAPKQTTITPPTSPGASSDFKIPSPRERPQTPTRSFMRILPSLNTRLHTAAQCLELLLATNPKFSSTTELSTLLPWPLLESIDRMGYSVLTPLLFHHWQIVFAHYLKQCYESSGISAFSGTTPLEEDIFYDSDSEDEEVEKNIANNIAIHARSPHDYEVHENDDWRSFQYFNAICEQFVKEPTLRANGLVQESPLDLFVLYSRSQMDDVNRGMYDKFVEGRLMEHAAQLMVCGIYNLSATEPSIRLQAFDLIIYLSSICSKNMDIGSAPSDWIDTHLKPFRHVLGSELHTLRHEAVARITDTLSTYFGALASQIVREALARLAIFEALKLPQKRSFVLYGCIGPFLRCIKLSQFSKDEATSTHSFLNFCFRVTRPPQTESTSDALVSSRLQVWRDLALVEENTAILLHFLIRFAHESHDGRVTASSMQWARAIVIALYRSFPVPVMTTLSTYLSIVPNTQPLTEDDGVPRDRASSSVCLHPSSFTNYIFDRDTYSSRDSTVLHLMKDFLCEPFDGFTAFLPPLVHYCLLHMSDSSANLSSSSLDRLISCNASVFKRDPNLRQDLKLIFQLIRRQHQHSQSLHRLRACCRQILLHLLRTTRYIFNANAKEQIQNIRNKALNAVDMHKELSVMEDQIQRTGVVIDLLQLYLESNLFHLEWSMGSHVVRLQRSTTMMHLSSINAQLAPRSLLPLPDGNIDAISFIRHFSQILKHLDSDLPRLIGKEAFQHGMLLWSEQNERFALPESIFPSTIEISNSSEGDGLDTSTIRKNLAAFAKVRQEEEATSIFLRALLIYNAIQWPIDTPSVKTLVSGISRCIHLIVLHYERAKNEMESSAQLLKVNAPSSLVVDADNIARQLAEAEDQVLMQKFCSLIYTLWYNVQTLYGRASVTQSATSRVSKYPTMVWTILALLHCSLDTIRPHIVDMVLVLFDDTALLPRRSDLNAVLPTLTAKTAAPFSSCNSSLMKLHASQKFNTSQNTRVPGLVLTPECVQQQTSGWFPAFEGVFPLLVRPFIESECDARILNIMLQCSTVENRTFVHHEDETRFGLSMLMTTLPWLVHILDMPSVQRGCVIQDARDYCDYMCQFMDCVVLAGRIPLCRLLQGFKSGEFDMEPTTFMQEVCDLLVQEFFPSLQDIANIAKSNDSMGESFSLAPEEPMPLAIVKMCIRTCHAYLKWGALPYQAIAIRIMSRLLTASSSEIIGKATAGALVSLFATVVPTAVRHSGDVVLNPLVTEYIAHVSSLSAMQLPQAVPSCEPLVKGAVLYGLKRVGVCITQE